MRAIWSFLLMVILGLGAGSEAFAQTTSNGDILLEQSGLSWRDVQSRLNGAGYDAGPADGLPGQRTRTALARFQRDNGLVASGQIDASTVTALQQVTVAPPTGTSVICSDEGGENIRFGPSARDFDVIVRLPNGTPIQVVERVTNQSGYDYFRITYGGGQSGFIWHKSVAPSCAGAPQPAPSPPQPAPSPPQPPVEVAEVDGPEAGILGTWRGAYNCEPYIGSEIVVTITDVEVTNVRKILGDVQILSADGAILSQGPHRSNVNMFNRELRLYPDNTNAIGVLGAPYNRLEGEMAADLATARMQVLGAYNALCPRGVTLRRDGAEDGPTAQGGPSVSEGLDLNARLSGADLDPARPCADTRTARGEAFCLSAAVQRYARTGEIRDFVDYSFMKTLLDGSGQFVHAPQNCQYYADAIDRIREDVTGRDGVAFPRGNSCEDAMALVRALGLPNPRVESCGRVRTYEQLRICADDVLDLLGDGTWKSDRDELIAAWSTADGTVPGIPLGLRPISGSFSFMQTLSTSAQTCVRGNSFGSHGFAQLIARHEAFLREPGQLSQVLGAAQNVIDCDMVTRLAAELGRLPRRDYAAYSEAAAQAEAYRCSDERANTPPERLDLIAALNRVVVAECSAGALLENWIKRSAAGQTPTSLFAAGFWSFERREASCRLNSQLTTHFYAPQVTIWVGDVRGADCNATGEGAFSCQMQPVASVASNDDALADGFRAVYSALYPLDVSLSFDRASCTWQADRVEEIR